MHSVQGYAFGHIGLCYLFWGGLSYMGYAALMGHA